MKKILSLCFVFLIICAQVFAKKSKNVSDTISIQNFKSGLGLYSFWKYKIGDDRSWAAINIDESDWKKISADDDSTDSDSLLKNLVGIGWFRTSFYIDSSINSMPLALQMRTSGACDVFIDGRLIRSLGTVGKTEKEQVSGFSLRSRIIPVPVNTTGRHVIAIRSSNFNTRNSGKVGGLNISPGFSAYDFNAEVLSLQKAIDDQEEISIMTVPMFFCGVFIVLSIFHLVLFLYYRRNRSNLYYSLFTFFIFLVFFGVYRTVAGTDIQTTKTLFILGFWSTLVVPLFFIGILYEVFYKRLLKFFWILSGLVVISIVSMTVFDAEGVGGVALVIFLMAGFIETIRIFIKAWIKKREGSRIFIFGLLFPLIGLIIINIICWILRKSGLKELADHISEQRIEFFLYSMLMSVSISMTIYLARDFARMNKKLSEQIKEIKQLFNRSIEQENEKKKILENQNVELERMVTLRTEEVVRQKAEIELKNRDIMDNLLYARRIQEAILPETRLIYEALKESFIIYWPKDIVSGDFYSFSQRDGRVILAAADCTGHGVTGAFMSMIGSSVLNQIVNERGVTQPSLILNNLNEGISEALKQNETDINDGMDIALCNFDLMNLTLQFAGANRPLWIFRKDELMEIKPDKLAIGGFRILRDATFTNHEIRLQSGDTIYLFTDGYPDQFGGPNGKKLLSKQFREILTSIQPLSMREQEKKLTDIFNEWKGNQTQVDDVLVIGIRV